MSQLRKSQSMKLWFAAVAGQVICLLLGLRSTFPLGLSEHMSEPSNNFMKTSVSSEGLKPMGMAICPGRRPSDSVDVKVSSP